MLRRLSSARQAALQTFRFHADVCVTVNSLPQISQTR
jgi:hypothetical protein